MEPMAEEEHDSDEEFRILDSRIAEQVLLEKNRAQINNGLKLQRKCVQVGRCPVCTLKPPCKHRKQVDPTVNPDLVGVSPAKVKRGMSISVAGDPNSDHSADR